MNSVGYKAAYEAEKALVKRFHLPNPYADEVHKKTRALRERMRFTAAPEHVPTVGGDGFMSDWVNCSCGWESSHYWDGVDYAMGDWYKHVYEVA